MRGIVKRTLIYFSVFITLVGLAFTALSFSDVYKYESLTQKRSEYLKAPKEGQTLDEIFADIGDHELELFKKRAGEARSEMGFWGFVALLPIPLTAFFWFSANWILYGSFWGPKAE